MQSNSTTVAGHSKQGGKAQNVGLIDAINQAFALFRLNYHNQYLKAFGNTSELNEVKRLWLEILGKYDAATILTAAKAVIETTEYLPTLRTMIHHCDRASKKLSLPDAHSAYIEACRAPSPKAAYTWSHPAVYHAGKDCDWFFLQSSAEALAYPIFRRKYEEICERIREGERFDSPSAPTLEKKPPAPLDKAANKSKLDALRASLDL